MSSPSPSQSYPNTHHGADPLLRLRRRCLRLFVLLVAALSFGCSSEPTGYDGPGDDAGTDVTDNADPNDGNGESTFSVGGHVSGLEGAGLVLGMNDDHALHVDDSGPFTFNAELEDGSSYDVSVLTQPTGPQQDCEVSGGSGTIDGDDVDDIEVACQTPAPPEPASFDVTIDVPSSELEVHATETVLVAVEIDNIGDESGTVDIDLTIDDEYEATQQLQVDGLATESLTFEWATDVSDVGTYTAEASSPDDTDSAPVTVDTPTCEQRTLLGDLGEWELADDVVYDRDSDPSSYFGVFMGEEFPGTKNSFNFYLPKYEYAAMEFTVPDHFGPEDQGGWAMEVASVVFWGTEYGQGLMYVTISECPGDFDINHFQDEACINVEDSGAGIHPTRWSSDPDHDYCYLEPGKTYYLNVMYTSDFDESLFPPPQSSCNDYPNCATLLKPH